MCWVYFNVVVVTHMKKVGASFLWFFALLLVYVLSSGPAILVYHTRLFHFIIFVYTPLTYFASYTPAYKVLMPYWQFWMDLAGTDGCPFMLG